MPATLTAIRAAALDMAGRTRSPSYAVELRLIALDCEYALEGDAASLESVLEYLAADHELEITAAQRADDEALIARRAA